MQRHSMAITANKCLLFPIQDTSSMNSLINLPDGCPVEIFEEKDGSKSVRKFPVQVLWGDVRLHTNDCHPSEEKRRFRSESIASSSEDNNQNKEYLMSGPVVDDTGDVDMEIVAVNLRHPEQQGFPLVTVATSVQSGLTYNKSYRLNSPFMTSDHLSEIRHDGSADSNEGGKRVWQCALLGLPFETVVEDLYSFLEPYACDIKSVVMLEPLLSGGIDQVDVENKSQSSQSIEMTIKDSKLCVINFLNKGALVSFHAVYHDLHFPIHTDATTPPCVTLQLAAFSVEGTGDTPLHQHSRGVDNVDNFCPTPEIPSSLQLPTCTVCIRRLTRAVSGLHVCNQQTSVESISSSTGGIPTEILLLGPDYVGNGDRCEVCLRYGNAHNTAALPKSYCQVCSITENIWVCLQCGYTGCGRYTAQHAKNHYHRAGHPFALELVTGRIWSYVGDRFVHVDPLSEYSNIPSIHSDQWTSAMTLSQRTQAPSSRTGKGSGRVHDEDSLCSSMKSCVCTLRENYTDNTGEERSTRRMLDRLDINTSNKLGTLQQDYDSVLEMQLKEQELYYEKLIARETVRLLESGYAEYGCNEDIMSQDGGVSSTMLPMSENDLVIIEALKLDISAIEYDYNEVLQELRLQESITASVRQENNKLLKSQKALRTIISDRISRTHEIKEKERKQTVALQQEIRDMEFYLRTSQEISQAAPEVQNDVRDGTVLIGEGKSSNDTVGKGRKNGTVSGNSGHKKGKKKR